MKHGWATEERLAEARQHYRRCLLCEHRCGADRLAGRRGPCKAGSEARVFRHRVEYSEEAELIPSHLFYLSGCDLRCAFCIAEVNAFDPRRGRVLTPEFFQEALAWGRQHKARTLQWVGGEPTIHLPAILEAMAPCPQVPPVVWKSDFYSTPAALALLDGVVDVYLADFKFGNDACARRIGGVDRYVEVVTRNLTLAARQGDLIVRHLLLPGHFDCCYRPIVQWIRRYLPAVKFSLRDGYLPYWQARHHEELSRPLSRFDAGRARDAAREAGLNLVY
jgi:putative pyruvate formate lyase activating enzyme